MTVPPPDFVKKSMSNLRRIATCGSSVKFDGHHRNIYYRDIVRAVLSTDDQIVLMHIGPLHDAFISDIVQYLIDSSIDPSRFAYAGPVTDLRSFLIDNNIDLYLQSYPTGGGLTAVEVQSIGVPAIYANPDLWSATLARCRSLYASTDLEWNSLNEISRVIINALDPDCWREFSDQANQKYLSSFHPQKGGEFLVSLRDAFL
jgi:hypothetical protein